MALLRRWFDRLRRHSLRLTKYGLVGIAGFVVDVGGFNLLRFAGGHGPLYGMPLAAKAISTGMGIVVAWLGHRYWTFRENRRSAVHREFVVFVVVSLIGLGISLAPLAISHYALGLRSPLADNISANIVGLGLATAFRYWAMQTRVFTETRYTPPGISSPSTADSAGEKGSVQLVGEVTDAWRSEPSDRGASLG
ncbi:GtrA family protein [Actinoplanes sp. KI2]|uniref:GtrA family protein n=1 Tax=Actinoplanes sp. KI2 TaxID=2983315 RepID=UPI0021D57AB3|nr:GtrA family protein [Actinoplanes sp. KI2]MCU7722847.1 GtrA family protein [Actinoplanes sp. KI2]